jgi:hypothetical protein
MIVNKVVDLDPSDQLIREVSGVAASFGLRDMSEAMIHLVTSIRPQQNGQIMFLITDQNAAESITTLLSLAIINYASWKHEEFSLEILLGGNEEKIRIFRDMPPEQYKEYGDMYFVQAKELIKKYFPPEDPS